MASPAPVSARLSRLARYVRPYTGRLALALVGLVGSSALGLVHPWVFGRVVDAAFTAGDSTGLDEMALLLLVLFAVQAGFVWLRHYWMSWLGERVVADLRLDLQRHLLRMDLDFFHRHRTGELLSRLADDVSRLQDLVGQDLSMLLRNVLALLGGVGMLFWIDRRLALTMLLVVPPIVLAAAAWGRTIRRLSRESQGKLAGASGTLGEGLGAIDTVQAFTREEHEAARYRHAVEAAFHFMEQRVRARSSFMAGTSFLAMATLAGIFWLGAHRVVAGELTAGTLASFFFYTMAVGAAVGALAAVYSRTVNALGATERIFEILDEVPAIADPATPVSLPSPRGELAFRGVRFAYGDRDGSVVDELDLEIQPGQVCALVGASGAGKSTIARLALRFWDPDAGTVSLDGHDLRTLRLADLRGAAAIVSQDPVLFSGTIRENIRYGSLDASDAAVEAAARAAHAHEFVSGFPDGYDTVVGERGLKLSGGQRQRVSIARAILRDPRLLILDEATSALDAESEALVQEALENLQEGRTTLVIAHRLSTVRDADRIVVLEQGRVVEQGRHHELVASEGAYARLVQRQATG
jgi:ABC transporter fused permease/ATP-binding protein